MLWLCGWTQLACVGGSGSGDYMHFQFPATHTVDTWCHACWPVRLLIQQHFPVALVSTVVSIHDRPDCQEDAVIKHRSKIHSQTVPSAEHMCAECHVPYDRKPWWPFLHCSGSWYHLLTCYPHASHSCASASQQGWDATKFMTLLDKLEQMHLKVTAGTVHQTTLRSTGICLYLSRCYYCPLKAIVASAQVLQPSAIHCSVH